MRSRGFERFRASDGTGVLDPPGRRGRSREEGGEGSAGPPEDGAGDSGGGDGGGGWSWDGWRAPDPEPRREPATGDASLFALTLALIGISVLFVVFLGVWIMLRRTSVEWPPEGAPAPPGALWVSTLLLGASSLAMVRVTRAARDGHRAETAGWLGWTVLLGLGFLSAQGLLWAQLAGAGLLPSSGGYGAVFYALTGLHGFHVLLGLGFASWLALRARRPRLPLPRGAIRLGATYWHFMGALWAVLFTVIYFVR